MSQKSELQKIASEPFFSIGVTTYERVELLIAAVNSILGQTFRDFEVIVSNDNPGRTLTGETLGINDPRVIFINQTENLGEFHNMDHLLKVSRGRYFTWLADDDYYAPNFLHEVYKAIHAEKNEPLCVLTSFQIVCGNPVPSQNPEKEIKTQRVLVYNGQQFLQDYWKGRIKVIGTTGFYTKQYLAGIGGLKKLTNMPIAIFSEYLLIMQVSLLEKVIVIDAPLIYYRAHEGSWSESNKDHKSSETAGMNFLKMSMEIFKSPLADKNYFRENMTGSMKLILKTVAHTSARRNNVITALFNFKYLSDLKPLVWTLKGTELFHKGVRSYLYASVWFLLYFPRILLIVLMPDSMKIIIKKMRYHAQGEIA
jgi:glycosyltransferase involved in cell wall biosynthesis